jgi:TonB family protein
MLDLLRTHGLALGAGIVLVALAGLGIRWVVRTQQAPPPRKAPQLRIVAVQPSPPPQKPSPPPPPVPPPKGEEQPQTNRVELKAADLTPPDAPRPPSDPGPAPGGRLALAAEGDGPGDAFNLAGNPGGRGLLSGGGLGDGAGDGLSQGGTGNRFGWYYAKLASEIEDALRREKALSSASTRVEVRIWADAAGRIGRVQLLRSTGDPRVDAAIQSIVGLRLREAPPPEIPMPMIARLTARRPG